METCPKVTIIVPVKNESRTIAYTIESLLNLDYPSYEVVVVDGGSKDETVDIARKYCVKVIEATDSAPGQGRNVGIRNSSSEIIAFIDGDCSASKNWLGEAVILLKKDRVGGVGGPVVPDDQATYLSKAILNVLSTFLATAGSPQFARYAEQREVYAIPSCNAIYPRTVLDEIGLFSEELRFCEDADLNYKIREKGYRIIYSPKVIVEHDWKGRSLASLFRIMLDYGAGRGVASRRNRHLFSITHMIPSAALLGIMLLFVFSLVFAGIFSTLLTCLTLSYITLTFLSAAFAAYRFKDIKIIPVAAGAYILTHVGYAIGFMRGVTSRLR